MSEFILLLTPAALNFKDELIREMASRFPDHISTPAMAISVTALFQSEAPQD